MPASAPTGLASAGSVLWCAITDVYDLRPDELAVLESACFEADLIRMLQDGLQDQPLMVKGSMGQQVINPIISDLKMHRATQASLLKQLRLPDESGADAAAGERSSAARAAVSARWSQRGA